MRPPRTSRAGSQASSIDPDRPVAAPGRDEQDSTARQRHDALGQVQRDDPAAFVEPADGDLEDPVQVDPGAPSAREGEDVGAWDLAGLADQVAGAEVPAEVGVLEGEDAEQEGQRQEAAIRSTASTPGGPAAWRTTGGAARGRAPVDLGIGRTLAGLRPVPRERSADDSEPGEPSVDAAGRRRDRSMRRSPEC